ncbi:polysaccharide export protein [Thalassospira sp. MA62]|nr:polysaccharide export protein [Thalassospira sp. MA62]
MHCIRRAMMMVMTVLMIPVLGLMVTCLPIRPSQAQTIFTVDSGDTLNIRVFDEPALSGEFSVDAHGRIQPALIGPISVRGLTADQIAQNIKAAYRDGYLRHPEVRVEIIAFRPFFILGEVNQPGSYDYAPGMNVLSAIALGGGLTYRGDEDDIEITRGNDTNRRQIPATLATIVMPGDIVRIAERYF